MALEVTVRSRQRHWADLEQVAIAARHQVGLIDCREEHLPAPCRVRACVSSQPFEEDK